MNYQNYAKIEVIAPSGEQGRLTVGVCTVRHQGIYNHHIWEAQEFLKQKYGEATQNGDLFSERNNENIALRNRAAMLASFRKFEIATIEEQEITGWTEADLPAEWVNLETFSDSMPLEIYEEWAEAAIRLNPGLFAVSLGDDQKKGLRVTTSYSTSL